MMILFGKQFANSSEYGLEKMGQVTRRAKAYFGCADNYRRSCSPLHCFRVEGLGVREQRCVGESVFPLTPALSPEAGEREENAGKSRPTRYFAPLNEVPRPPSTEKVLDFRL